jgi:hypothetical protein
VIYQDPLAYLLGLEGIALLDAWAGDHDREFVDARLAEIRRLAGLAVVADGLPSAAGAGRWQLPLAGHLALPAARRMTPRK